jgi:hypothetical protein
MEARFSATGPVPLNLQMNETRILIRLLRMYIPKKLGTQLSFGKF